MSSLPLRVCVCALKPCAIHRIKAYTGMHAQVQDTGMHAQVQDTGMGGGMELELHTACLQALQHFTFQGPNKSLSTDTTEVYNIVG